MTTQRFVNAQHRVFDLSLQLDMCEELLGGDLSGRDTKKLLAKRTRLVKELTVARAELEAARPAASARVRAAARDML